jgi:hypothetical protein
MHGFFMPNIVGMNEITFKLDKYIQYRHLIPLETSQISFGELALSFEKDINFLPMELFSSRGSSREGIVP